MSGQNGDRSADAALRPSMVGAIVRASLARRVPVIAGTVLLMLLGLFAAARLDIDVLPDVSRPALVVMTEAGGLAPEEVETLVTAPLERALAGLPATLRLRSSSAVGLSIVTVELDWGADVVAARQQAAERLAAARDSLPAGVVAQIQPVSSIMGEIMLIGLTSDAASDTPAKIDAMALRGIADWTVRPRLAAIAGVSQVTVIGGETRQVRIAPDPALMAGLDVAVADIERALARVGVNAGGGAVDQGAAEFVIRALAPDIEIETLGNTVIATRRNAPILLRQIARVGVAAKPARGSAGLDGGDAVILSVQKQPGADTLRLTAAVTAALGELQGAMPAGVKADRVIFRQADFITVGLGNVGRALLESSLVVAVVLFLLLGSARPTMISLAAIPISLLSALIAFRLMGVGINTMTLGGFAIAIGELVDDAVVDVENVFRRLRENVARGSPRRALDVVAAASVEVRTGILTATLIIVMVLAPLFVLSGVEGQLLRPLALAYVVAIVASLATAMTVTPVLCLCVAGRSPPAREAPLARICKGWLDRSLPWGLAHPGALAGGAGLAIVVAVVLLTLLPRSLMPPFNEGSITVELNATPGITLADSSRLGALAERLLMQVPEVASVGRRTGRAESDEHAQGIETTEIDARLRDSGRPRRDIVRDMRERLAVLPVAINIGQPVSHRIDHLTSGVRAEVVIKVFGDDLDTAEAIAAWLRDEMSGIAGLTDIQVERQARIPVIELAPHAARAALYGVPPHAVNDAVTGLANGKLLSQVIEGAQRTDVMLRLDERDRTSTGLSHLLVETAAGRLPVRLLADVIETDGRNRIEREDGRRRLAVYANTQGQDVGRTIGALRVAMAGMALPAGYMMTLEGTFAGQERAARQVAAYGSLALVAIFSLLAWRYGSGALALVVMGSVPLSLVGGVAALWLFGLPLSLASVVGFVTLAGISLRNGILKVSHFLNLALREGVGFGDELVLRGSRERLTPVLTTALAAAFALLPLLAGAESAGKEILHPVAVVVFGGLISATLLDTFLTPVLFRRFGGKPLARLTSRRDWGAQESGL
ncbi:MAG TPA: efflux RND transporter permease subunit [Xanthobacteraceae bacterium]|jgi:HME family heavy-metal exporter|nr:efflux RND transporter permease subunit [Xanthobacteraceae bacterium]